MMSETQSDYPVFQSNFGWGDEEDDMSTDQVVNCLLRGDLRSFSYNLSNQFALDHHDLIKAYISTLFVVEDITAVVKVGKYSRAAHQVTATIEQSRASRKGLVLVSAFNPCGVSLSWAENQAAQERLINDMKREGLLLAQGKGIASIPNEKGNLFWEAICAVGPIDENEAKSLAIRYQQIAVIYTGTLEVSKLIFSGIEPASSSNTASR